MFQDEGIQIDTDWIDTLNTREDKDFLDFHALDTNEIEANQKETSKKLMRNLPVKKKPVHVVKIC